MWESCFLERRLAAARIQMNLKYRTALRHVVQGLVSVLSILALPNMYSLFRTGDLWLSRSSVKCR
jgi:hypothetical protein